MHCSRTVKQLVFGSLALLAVSATAPAQPPIADASDAPFERSESLLQGTLDTANFWSQSLGLRKNFVVWLPPSYQSQSSRRYPVAYYLHGIYGAETNWTEIGGIAHTLDSLSAGGMPELIVVMPDGDDGWYTTWNFLGDYAGCRREFVPRSGDSVDSYCVPWPHYDDYIARDLVAWVDSTWRTIPDREHRAIAGLSMGGYGAITLALSYPDVFSAAASHSGVLSPLYVGPVALTVPPLYGGDMDALRQRWGERFWPRIRPMFGPDTTGWWSRDPSRKARKLSARNPGAMPALFFDVGTADSSILGQNRAFHYELTQLSIPHTYNEWPGGHEWPYWRLHVRESLRWIAEHISR